MVSTRQRFLTFRGLSPKQIPLTNLIGPSKQLPQVGWNAKLMTGRAVPWAFTVEKFMNKEEYKDCLRLLCDFDAISDKAERVNITLPSRVLRRFDFLAQEAGDSRYGCIARMVASQRA